MAILYYHIEYWIDPITVHPLATAESVEEMVKETEMNEDTWALENREKNDGEWEITSVDPDQDSSLYKKLVDAGIDRPDQYDYLDGDGYSLLFVDDQVN